MRVKKDFFNQLRRELTQVENIGINENKEKTHPPMAHQALHDLSEEAQLMRHRQGIEEGSVRSMLSNWKKRGYIEVYGNVLPQNEASRQQYIKTPAYLEKHPQAA